MKSGPTSSGRSSKKRDFGRGASTAIAVMAQVPSLRMLAPAPLPIEIAQLRLAHREQVPGAGRNTLERRVRRQLGRDLSFRGSAVERAVQDVLRAEVLHAVDAERELDNCGAVEQLLGQEILGAKAHRSALALDQVHGRRGEKARDEFVRRMLIDFGRSAHLPQPAVIDHRDAIAHPHGLDLIVRHIDGGGAHGPLELLELAAGARAQLRVEVREWLIQQEYRWVADQRPRERDTLTLAAGKLARTAPRKMVDAEQTGCPFDLAFDLIARRALRPQWERDVVPNREVRIEPVALKDHGDAAPARRYVIDDLSIDQDLPGRGLFQTRDDSQQRGLAASRRPEQHHELAIACLEADAVDGHHVAELFPDLVDSNRDHVDLLDGQGVAVPRSPRRRAGDLMHPP